MKAKNEMFSVNVEQTVEVGDRSMTVYSDGLDDVVPVQGDTFINNHKKIIILTVKNLEKRKERILWVFPGLDIYRYKIYTDRPIMTRIPKNATITLTPDYISRAKQKEYKIQMDEVSREYRKNHASSL